MLSVKTIPPKLKFVWFHLRNILKMTVIVMENKLVFVGIMKEWSQERSMWS